MKNNEKLIEVVNGTPVISKTTIASLIENNENMIDTLFSDEEIELKQLGKIIIRKNDKKIETFLNERQAYYIINLHTNDIDSKYIMRKLISDFYFVQHKLEKKKNRKLLKKYIKEISSINNLKV